MPVRRQVAAQAEDAAIAFVVGVIVPRTASRIAQRDDHRSALRVGEADRGADLVAFGRRQIGVRAIDAERHREGRGGRQADVRLVAHEHEFAIDFGGVGKFEVGEQIGVDTLVGRLQIVGVAVVEAVGTAIGAQAVPRRSIEREAATHRTRRGIGELKLCGRRRARQRAGVAGGGGVEVAGRKVAGGGADAVDRPIADEGGDVAATAGEVLAERQRYALLAAVLVVAAIGRGAGGAGDAADRIVVGVREQTRSGIELETVEVALQDEIDDAGERVRAVDCRRAAGDDVDALD